MPSIRKRKAALKLAAKPAPRNPFAVAARQRAAGPHGASTKARRQQQKRQLRKLLEQS
jgi:hypothetical protein